MMSFSTTLGKLYIHIIVNAIQLSLLLIANQNVMEYIVKSWKGMLEITLDWWLSKLMAVLQVGQVKKQVP